MSAFDVRWASPAAAALANLDAATRTTVDRFVTTTLRFDVHGLSVPLTGALDGWRSVHVGTTGVRLLVKLVNETLWVGRLTSTVPARSRPSLTTPWVTTLLRSTAALLNAAGLPAELVPVPSLAPDVQGVAVVHSADAPVVAATVWGDRFWIAPAGTGGQFEPREMLGLTCEQPLTDVDFALALAAMQALTLALWADASPVLWPVPDEIPRPAKRYGARHRAAVLNELGPLIGPMLSLSSPDTTAETTYWFHGYVTATIGELAAQQRWPSPWNRLAAMSEIPVHGQREAHAVVAAGAALGIDVEVVPVSEPTLAFGVRVRNSDVHALAFIHGAWHMTVTAGQAIAATSIRVLREPDGSPLSASRVASLLPDWTQALLYTSLE